jgi:hypothetical protein
MRRRGRLGLRSNRRWHFKSPERDGYCLLVPAESIFFFWMCHEGSLHNVHVAPLNILAAVASFRVVHSSQFDAITPMSPAFFAPKVPMCCSSVCQP